MNWDDYGEKKKKLKPSKKYIAVVGINYGMDNKRIEAGEEIPEDLVKDKAAFNWLLRRRKAIREA